MRIEVVIVIVPLIDLIDRVPDILKEVIIQALVSETTVKWFDQMIADGRYEEFEKLVLDDKASLEDLSEEMFQKFKEWIEGENHHP